MWSTRFGRGNGLVIKVDYTERELPGTAVRFMMLVIIMIVSLYDALN